MLCCGIVTCRSRYLQKAIVLHSHLLHSPAFAAQHMRTCHGVQLVLQAEMDEMIRKRKEKADKKAHAKQHAHILKVLC
jgi:hypothetical protein